MSHIEKVVIRNLDFRRRPGSDHDSTASVTECTPGYNISCPTHHQVVTEMYRGDGEVLAAQYELPRVFTCSSNIHLLL